MKKYILKIGDKDYKAEVKEITADLATIVVNDTEYKIELKELGRKAGFKIPSTGSAAPAPAAAPVAATTAPAAAPAAASPAAPAAAPSGDSETVKAPLPGLIVDIMVKDGHQVKAGQNLLVMEAMKMENQVQAPYDGTVKRVIVSKGDTVAEGDVLVEISRPLMTTV